MPKEADQKEQITHPSIDPSPGRIAGVNGNVRAASRNNFSLAVASRYNAPHEVQPAEPAVSDKPKRRWYQFSVSSLLLVVTLSAITTGFGFCLKHRPFCFKMRAEYAEEQKHIGT